MKRRKRERSLEGIKTSEKQKKCEELSAQIQLVAIKLIAAKIIFGHSLC